MKIWTLLLALGGVAVGGISAESSRTPRPPADAFAHTVQPFIAKHCLPCHDAQLKTSDLNFEVYRRAEDVLRNRELWERVAQRIDAGEMPPKGRPRPTKPEVRAVTRWIQEQLAQPDRHGPPDPGRVTARRLNRVEYNNTIRDLLGVDLQPAEDFPADDSGYGFDNIADVLSLSPLLMEKYLAAAEKIARAAIPVDPPPKPVLERYRAERLRQAGAGPNAAATPDAIRVKHRFPVDAEYDLQVDVGGKKLDHSEVVKVTVWLDGEPVTAVDLDRQREKPWIVGARTRVRTGEHELRATLVDHSPEADGAVPAGRDRPPTLDGLRVAGPFNPTPPTATESYKRVFTCTPADRSQEDVCARQILSGLARRAYRRPVTGQEVDTLMRYVVLAEKEGESFERGIRLALQAVLVSPHFLFRIERDPEPGNPKAAHRISDHELAARLSYFLWSSMPDDELFRLADEGTLHRPDVLAAQVRRMLGDPKAQALAENFAGQWLQLRNLDSVRPDPARFPNFNEELRAAMRRETQLFFEAIVREDRSILDFIDGRFTFLNETLAKHYGIPGVVGPSFRRVELDGEQRSGVLTQASILTVSSYPTRTSPVLRGKWVLENFLNAPPPPPPPGVANVNEEAVGATGTMRQQMEKHRSDPNCLSCHARMDPLGFGLENYDAIGHWRTQDGRFPVDATGELPGGRSFKTPAELKAILESEREAFSRCLTEKLLTYALGRGVTRDDRPVIQEIGRRLAADGYRFSRLVLEIVNSPPFQMRRGEGGNRP